jgi:hypothetical protein
MALYYDNRFDIDLAVNHPISDLSQHIDIQYLHVHELVYDKILPLI